MEFVSRKKMENQTDQNKPRIIKGALVLRDRQRDDFYPTPNECTRVLMENEPPFIGRVWECACGTGWMSRILDGEYGLDLFSSDLLHTGFGHGGIDFTLPNTIKADHIITNPPFKLFLEFLERALSIVPDNGRVCFFLPLDYIAGTTRMKVYKRTPLARVYVLARRATLLKDGAEKTGSGMTNFAWFVWDKTHPIGKPFETSIFDQADYLKEGEILDGVPITPRKKKIVPVAEFPLLD